MNSCSFSSRLNPHDFVPAGRAADDFHLPAFHAEMLGEQFDRRLVCPAIFGRSGHVHFEFAGRISDHSIAFGARLNADFDCLFAGDAG